MLASCVVLQAISGLAILFTGPKLAEMGPETGPTLGRAIFSVAYDHEIRLTSPRKESIRGSHGGYLLLFLVDLQNKVVDTDCVPSTSIRLMPL